MFGELRATRSKKGEPLFCLSDVCKALELSNPSVTKERLVRDLSIIKVSKEVVAHGKNTGVFKEEEMYFVSEPGFYRCIFRSNKKGGEDVISATSELYDKMQDAIAASIRETLTDTGIHEL